MANELYTLTMVRSLIVKTATGEVSQDTVETYYDQTFEQSLSYRRKFPGASVQIEKQSRRLDKQMKIQIGESPVTVARTPFKEDGVATKAVNWKATGPKPVRSARTGATLAPAGYGELVNVIMEGERA